ncbi:GNAT family N-acetyltransferase [Patescibacteria group bacterium]|nr:GNAT family N-acetyltransferase [Patescibacteria group bacterium]
MHKEFEMIIIREAYRGELKKVALMHNCILKLHTELLPRIFHDLVKTDDVISELEDYIKGNNVIYVAELRGKLVGYIAARITEIGGDLRRRKIEVLYIDAIYLESSARDCTKRIANQLYEKALQYAKRNKIKAISYDFWEENEIGSAFCKNRPEQNGAHNQIRRIIFI